MSIDLCNIIASDPSKPDFRPTCIAIFFLLKIALGKRAKRKAQKRIAESTEIYNKYVTNMYTGTKVAIPYKLMHFDAEI